MGDADGSSDEAGFGDEVALAIGIGFSSMVTSVVPGTPSSMAATTSGAFATSAVANAVPSASTPMVDHTATRTPTRV
ncbi:unannotated protein [freshwater metagenome]|uniref:Unannotated protein n=1 Tax=freshwater metagenome TaxID=449393 RepID=A0A6J6NAJ2_9ZZZZ